MSGNLYCIDQFFFFSGIPFVPVYCWKSEQIGFSDSENRCRSVWIALVILVDGGLAERLAPGH